MTNFQISLHAQEQMLSRSIPEPIVFEVMSSPDEILTENEGQLIYQKRIFFENGKEYLVRTFVNSDKEPPLIKTVYRTSKFSKYE